MTRYEEVVRQAKGRYDNKCWYFPSNDGQGYAVLRYKGEVIKACILAYRIRYGYPPLGTILDHTCMNKGCWNPDHLEPVTHAVNVSRGSNAGGSAQNTHCINGHPYSPENTLYTSTQRHCRTCRRESQRERRKKANLVA